jgi:5-methyltetrahydropteroyltriglutamate--homocysteine methyltransferase
VVAATRGLDRGRTDQAAVEAAFRQDLARWIEVQQQAGLDFFSDGLLGWQDIFRPLSDRFEVKPHTLVRWFDTNTFFREPELDGAVPAMHKLDPKLVDASIPSPRVVSLPSPYMFSRASHSRRLRNELMLDLAANVLKPAVKAAVSQGAQLIHLEEPWLGYYGAETADWEPFSRALEMIRPGSNATVALHIYFGDASRYMDQLGSLPIDAIGVDLIETDIGALGSNWNKALVAGVINGRSSILESVDNTIQVVRHLADALGPRDIYISSNTELAYLPTGVAERKVQRLGEAARTLKELVSV